MSQTSVSTYFSNRKRAIDDDTILNKNKVICLERAETLSLNNSNYDPSGTKVVFQDDVTGSLKATRKSVRQGISSQRVTRSKKCTEDGPPIAGNVSSKKTIAAAKVAPELKTPIKIQKSAQNEDFVKQIDRLKTPTKQVIPSMVSTSPAMSRGQLMAKMGADEIRKKLQKSTKLTELKTKLNKLQGGLDRLEQLEERNIALPKLIPKKLQTLAEASPKKSLKVFNNIELEIISPRKQFASPLKLMDSPSKNALMMSPKTTTPRKLIFSPTKPSTSEQLPAYQRYQNLAQSGVSTTLQLPFKYRNLLEIFKGLDTVCSMFFNRKEKITFKKMKPAVSRMLRKNVTEAHLAQIQKLYPESYSYAQEKTRNYGSTSKQDYYQLVITPNMLLKEGAATLKYFNMSPIMLLERSQKFQQLLLERVMNEHDTFLQSLEVPMTIARKSLKRWHPLFDLEAVPDIELANLPHAPNVESFASAKDILSAARNLFNCATPMERALERLEAKKKEEKGKQVQHQQQQAKIEEGTTNVKLEQNVPAAHVTETNKNAALSTNSKALQGIPKALLEKIRAKQAAKALDTMTRRPSQDREAQKYSRLPELARHLRNVFITEKKGVLPVEIVLQKIENSYKELMTMKEIEEHLKIITKEIPSWLAFHEVRNTIYIKLARDSDFGKVSKHLEEMAKFKFQ